MLGWFRPSCPCDPAAKLWVEDRLRWLSGQFGLHVLLERPVVLPTAEFFPDPWDGSARAVGRMFRRVCQYMGADSETLEVRLFDNRPAGPPGALGTLGGFAAGTWEQGDGPWRPGVVRLERGSLDRPADLIGIMAHEIAHQRLLGEGRAEREAFDNELLTDLTAVYFGFGVFLANNPRKSTGELGRWPGTTLHRPEYLSEPMFGYALAHVAWHRDEDRPAWARHLRLAPRAVFKQGLRYLHKTGDSIFRPVRLRHGPGPRGLC
jgi:hypothetical protein